MAISFSICACVAIVNALPAWRVNFVFVPGWRLSMFSLGGELILYFCLCLVVEVKLVWIYNFVFCRIELL